jgi:hypothetical protein
VGTPTRHHARRPDHHPHAVLACLSTRCVLLCAAIRLSVVHRRQRMHAPGMRAWRPRPRLEAVAVVLLVGAPPPRNEDLIAFLFFQSRIFGLKGRDRIVSTQEVCDV